MTFFFPVGGHKSIINGMTSPRRSKMKATGAARRTAFATTQSQCSGKMISAHFPLVQLPKSGSEDLEQDQRNAQGQAEGKQKAKWNIGFSTFGSLVFSSDYDKVHI